MTTAGGIAPERVIPPVSIHGAAVVLLLLAGVGCASTELSQGDLLGQGSVVNELRPGAAAAAEMRARGTDGEASASADMAEARMAEGDFAGALEIIRAALQRAPAGNGSDRLRELRVRARRLFLKSAIADAVAEVTPKRITEGTPLRVRVHLRNLSPVPLELRSPGGDNSPTLLRLQVVRTARDVYGNVRSDTWEESHPFPPGTAAPGGALVLDVEFATERFRSAFPRGFVEYSFGGTILPSGVRVGDVEVHERLPVEEATADAFPEKWEEVAADPEGSIRRGLDAGNPVRILVAARCSEGDRRERIALFLAERLMRPPTLSPAVEGGVRSALRMLGGDVEADEWGPERWRARTAAAAAREGPVFEDGRGDR